ncbi:MULTISPECIES: tyrosine-type recombinase/integrase [unclassified Clostridium]|uniref:tyrosine-type recombinase/integrase n=1 Tax=unclassified Clostridium TaxID=2614128 RepID=UPI000297F058|nr:MULTISPECIES: tyrosine-type recombinase/integrase [unclassified Clostridium]EKQ50308.1 MAG: site-specific recombinase XerD [Clostridium sp. Maddingley MBC34-26]
MRGSVRKRGNIWYYRYRENDKLIEKRGGSKEEAEAKLTEVLYRMNSGYISDSDMLLKDYMLMWIDDYIKGEKSENTYNKYMQTIEKYINPMIGSIKLSDIKVMHIEKFIRDLKKVKVNTNKLISPTSVQSYYGILRSALNKAVKLQLINNSPCRFVDTPKRTKFKANILTIEELKLIYQKVNSDSYEDYIFRLALDITSETGLRRGELCGLDLDKHIDTEKQTLKVRQALIRVKNTYVLSEKLKTESSYRTLPISNSLCNKIENHKKILKMKRIKYGEFYIKNKFDDKYPNLLLVQENGKFIIPSSLLQRIKRLMKYCNIEKNIRWHDLRHTNATLLLEGGVSMKVLQERLGHSLMQTTSDIYAHVTDNLNREATQTISNILDLTK